MGALPTNTEVMAIFLGIRSFVTLNTAILRLTMVLPVLPGITRVVISAG